MSRRRTSDWIRRGSTGQFVGGAKKYAVLYKYASVKEWSERFQTEEGLSHCVTRFLQSTKTNPDSFLKLDPKKARDAVGNYLSNTAGNRQEMAEN